jgi:hypothetical protein
VFTEGAVLLFGALAAYAVVMGLAAWYGKGWQPPEGMEQSNWALRHKVGVSLGAAAVAVCVLLSVWLVQTPLARIMLVAQAVILAAAGASDIRIFQLPLPLTLGGIVFAIITAIVLKISWLFIAFGLVWAILICLFYAFLTKRAMALGDYIAAIWIGLAMPFNGLLAILSGDISNTLFVRWSGRGLAKGQKVAAAGPWLLFAAALVSLPPYFVLMNRQRVATTMPNQVVTGAKPPSSAKVAAEPLTEQQAAYKAAQQKLFWTLADYAGQQTASVALADTRAERIEQAAEAAVRVAEYEAIAQKYGADESLTRPMQQLSAALANYDVEGVRAASEQLAAERQKLYETISVNTSTTQN